MARPKAIALFAGAGGMDLGFEQAGFDVAAAVELDPVHAAVHQFNFPQCHMICQSVSTLTGDEIRRRAGLQGAHIAAVFGGGPCQGMSMIGKRVIDDPRNSLVRDFVRLVAELDADFGVFENVKGLTLGLHRQILDEMAEEFARVGYDFVRPWRVLQAAEYGVAQDRQRLFLFAVKRGRGLIPPKYPAPVTRMAGDAKTLSDLPPGPTVKDVLSDLPDAEDYVELNESDSVRVKFGKPSAWAELLRGTRVDPRDFSYERLWDRSVMTSSMRAEHTGISRARFRRTKSGEVEPVSRFYKLPLEGVSNTLRAGTDSERGAYTSPRPIHPIHPRCITVREMMRLHGYPDWFRMHVRKWHGAREVGNSVPVPLARAVAGELIRALGIRPSRPKKRIALGDESLLRLDMSAASAHFGIENPIPQRTRKDTKPGRRRTKASAPTDALQLPTTGD